MHDASDIAAVKRPRILTADRGQADPYPKSIDELIPKNHQARNIWKLVQQFDCQVLLEQIDAVEGRPGRPAIDPRILIALWLYATIDGIANARKLAAMTRYHDAYKWIAGGVSVSYHTLSDFRTHHNDWLESQVVKVVQELADEKLIQFDEVGQDGMRVRASAGNSSFKSEEKLARLVDQAQQQVDATLASDATSDCQMSDRQRSARKRASRERLERLKLAQEHRDQLAEAREKRKKGDGETTRASTTDPQARKMKMADGGYRPAYNFQYATLLGSLLIIGVAVTASGSDCGQMTPMLDQIESHYETVPQAYYADGGFAAIEDIEAIQRRGATAYVPVKASKSHPNRYQPRSNDSEIIASWRVRMGTAQAKERYKRRSLCEWSNAESRRHGIQQLSVRGIEKARSVALWHALVQNLLRAQSLRANRN